jgi:hypothetical protein
MRSIKNLNKIQPKTSIIKDLTLSEITEEILVEES